MTDSQMLRVAKRINKHLEKCHDLLVLIRESDHPRAEEIHEEITQEQGMTFLAYGVESFVRPYLGKRYNQP